MITKNETVTVEIERLGMNGEGVATLEDGMKIFIPFALPQERVKAMVLAVKKNFAYGKIKEILSSSPNRKESKCLVYTKCGGCQLRHLAYQAQLDFKRQTVEDTLRKVGGLTVSVDAVVPSPRQDGYRNKIQIPVGVDSQGKTVFGFFRDNSHDIVAIDECPLHGDWATRLLSAVRTYMRDAKLSGFDERCRRGDVRHIVAREVDGELLCCLVSPHKRLPQIERLVQALKDKGFLQPHITLNCNDRDTNVILGKETVCVYGQPRLTFNLMGLDVSLASESFLQVNTDVAKALYEAVAQEVGTDNDIVIDAYSGAGILSAVLARRAGQVYGIEICTPASRDAEDLAKRNGIKNLVNLNGDCAIEVPKLIAKLKGQNACISVVLDPPRKGCDARVLQAVKNAAPEKIIYVSCNPATLARDLKILTTADDANPTAYEVTLCRPYDMFPSTGHVETLVLLRTKSAETNNNSQG